MNWRTLLAKIGLCDPPVPDLPAMVREASDRSGTVNRRAFLQIAGAAVASTVLIDPESLIWSPGEKAILIPEAPVTLATLADLEELTGGGNTLCAPEWLMRETLRHLKNTLAFSKHAMRQYDTDFAREGAKIGDTVAVRIPQPFLISDAHAHLPQPIIDNVKAATISEQLTVEMPLAFGGLHRMTRQEASARIAKPVAESLASEMRFRRMEVTAPLALPLAQGGVEWSYRGTHHDSGLNLRAIEGHYYDPVSNQMHHVLRFDVLGGMMPNESLSREGLLMLARRKWQRKHRRTLNA